MKAGTIEWINEVEYNKLTGNKPVNNAAAIFDSWEMLYDHLYVNVETVDNSRMTTGKDIERRENTIVYNKWQKQEKSSKFWQWLDQNVPVPTA